MGESIVEDSRIGGPKCQDAEEYTDDCPEDNIVPVMTLG